MKLKQFLNELYEINFLHTNINEDFVNACSDFSIEMILKFIKSRPTGSRIICKPSPKDTDKDWICLVRQNTMNSLHEDLKNCNWNSDSESYKSHHFSTENYYFISYKKIIDDVIYNLIITESKEFYNRFCLATNLAKKLNLLEKQDRIDLFQTILYGKDHNDSFLNDNAITILNT